MLPGDLEERSIAAIAVDDDIAIVETPKSLSEIAREIQSAPGLQRGVLAVVVGTFILLWPNGSLTLTVGLAGLALVLSAVFDGYRRLRHAGAGRGPGRTVVDLVAGVLLILVSSFASQLLVVTLWATLLVRGVHDLYGAFRAWRAHSPSVWSLVRGVAQLVGAGAVSVLQEDLVIVALLLIGSSWVATGILSVVLAWTSPRGVSAPIAANEVMTEWFTTRDVGDELRNDVVAKLVFEGEENRKRIARFASLMAFATAIASLGVLTDSTAVVIGAMLVAPLMTPIMATSVSLVMGRPAVAIRSLTLVGAGVAIAVGLAFMIGRYVPGVVEIGVNTQIAARTEPTLLDLLIALAAGGAGGYAVCRPDVSDSLPGVAIAVALVPPLAVVGVTLASGDYALAMGSFLLFLTNLVGIIFASATTFVFAGVAPWQQLTSNLGQLRKMSVTVLAAMAIVAIPLAITGQEIFAASADRQQSSEATELWLQELPGFDLVQVDAANTDIEIVLIGDGRISAVQADDLARRLGAALDRDVLVELRIIPEQRLSAGTGSNK